MNKEELYKSAKDAYYKGSPIMSDAEFDALEDEIGVGGVGGTGEDGKKFKHLTRMLSLSKVQADKTTGKAPTEDMFQWINKSISISGNTEYLEVTPKYDGNAANCIYKNGKLWKVLSRYDGEYGMDRTSKIFNIIPKELPKEYSNVDVEIRGEVLMCTSVFNKKYSCKFANPRNFVAGILNRDDDTFVEDLSFVAYDGNVVVDGKRKCYLSIDEIKLLGFNLDNDIPVKQYVIGSDFDELFESMLKLREDMDFPLDGFVVKFPCSMRNLFEENEHDPDWAKAVKFKPIGVTTSIVGVEWNIGKTGCFTPVALLDPVDLDGSTVSKVSLYNAAYIESNDIKIGTRVRIVKSGDIIPQIVEIFK